MTEPSIHRKRMLRIAKSLSRQNVDEILYLSEDCIKTTSRVPSGVDLMRGLERNGMLGPGNYTFLLSCLREIGRIDLEQQLKKSLSTSHALPLVPASFCGPNQLFLVKLSGLGHKRGNFVSSMCCITDLKTNSQAWAPYINRKYTCLFSALTTSQDLPESFEIVKVLVTTLDNLSKSLVTWEKAVADFALTKDYSTLLTDVHQVGVLAKVFIAALDSIGWRKKWRTSEIEEIYELSPLYHASLHTSSTLRELANELFGECQLREATDKPAKNLHSIQFYAVQQFIIILHWLVTLIEFAAYCKVDLQSYKDFFKSMIEYHKPGITANQTFLHWLLNGTKLSEKIESEGLVKLESGNSSSPDDVVSLENALLPIVLPLTLFSLLYSEDFTPQDWLLVRKRMENYFVPLRKKMVVAYTGLCLSTAHNFGKEINHSLQHSIDLLDVGHDVRELVVEIFHC